MLPRSQATLAAALLLAAVGLAACSTGSFVPGATEQASDGGAAIGTTTCAVSASCPDGAVPSYKTEIAPFLEQSCIPCHSPGGPGGFDETTYEDVYNQRSPMLDQVYDCQMPPANGPQLTSAQRIALTGWLECGAPNN